MSMNNSKEKLMDLANVLLVMLARKYNIPQNTLAPFVRIIKSSIDSMTEDDASAIIEAINEVIR